MEHEELEFFEFTDEERANWIELLAKENMREKVVMYDPEVKWLPTGKVRLSFYFNFAFKEVK